MTRTSGNTSGTLGVVRFGNTNIDSNLAGINGIQDGATDSAKITFTTQPTSGSTTERMVIKSDGKVGIGATTPAYELDVPSGTVRGKQVFAKYGSNKLIQLTWGGTTSEGSCLLYTSPSPRDS